MKSIKKIIEERKPIIPTGEFEVRDLRDKHWFIVDDAYLNGYARACGTSATCVYLVLCRHADKDQKCWPSIRLIARKLGISQVTVQKAIGILLDYRIIKKSGKPGKSTLYTLVDKSLWKTK